MSVKINSEIYTKKEIIGRGEFGKVYKLEKDNKYYALKKILITNSTNEDISLIKKEIQILSSFNNEYIVKYYYNFFDKKYCNILMEYGGKMNLKQFINSYKDKGCLIEEIIISNIITQICLALKEIHKKNIIHRDLIPENIFINENHKIKIGDFGISKILNPNCAHNKTITEKILYLAPEIIKGEKYNYKADIYSFGCIIYELFTLNQYHIDKIIDNKQRKINTERYNPKWQMLIDNLLKNDYHERPKAEEIYNNIITDIICYKEYDRRGILIYEGEILNKKYNGRGKQYSFLNGLLEYEGEFKDGKWNGKGRKYCKGKLDYEGEYINDIRNGKGKEYDYNGALRFEGIYLDGKRWTGKGYNEKGIEEYELKDGKGVCKDYTFFTGKLIFEGEYINGKRNGKGKEYNDNGELIFEGEYLNGKKSNGIGKEYEFGHLIYFGEFVNGQRNGKGKEYNYNGILVFEGEYLNGKKNV